MGRLRKASETGGKVLLALQESGQVRINDMQKPSEKFQQSETKGLPVTFHAQFKVLIMMTCKALYKQGLGYPEEASLPLLSCKHSDNLGK